MRTSASQFSPHIGERVRSPTHFVSPRENHRFYLETSLSPQIHFPPGASEPGVQGLGECLFCGVYFGKGKGKKTASEKASAHKDRLLDFQRNSAKRTSVIDDQ